MSLSSTSVNLQNIRNTTLQQRFTCLWCASENTCKSFRATSVIPLQGVPCPEFKYNVGTCTSKLNFICCMPLCDIKDGSTLLVKRLCAPPACMMKFVQMSEFLLTFGVYGNDIMIMTCIQHGGYAVLVLIFALNV